MLSYELAKELRDNGFSQDFPNEYEDSQAEFFCLNIHTNIITVLWVSAEELRSDDLFINDGELRVECKSPTLSELIEEIGDRFVALVQDGDNSWDASSILHAGNGKTPEAAVANLWLELNKK